MQTTRLPVENSHRPARRPRLTGWTVFIGVICVAILVTWSAGRRPVHSGIASVSVLFLEAGEASGPGRPFVLELELERDGYPVILHVDADGLPSVLFPFSTPTRLSAGRRIRLPDPSGSATWWAPLGVDAGTLLIAMESDSPHSTDRLLELAERAAAQAPDAATAKESVRRVLRDRLGPAVVAELGTIR